MLQSDARGERVIRAILVTVLVLTCGRVWLGESLATPVAEAQAFDPAAQRKAIADAIERSNELLTEIRDLLKKGVINVRVRSTDNQPGRSDEDAMDGP